MQQRLSVEKRFRLFISALCTTFLLLGFTGCEDHEDHYNDHVPPTGKGSLVIDNLTVDDINAYVDGQSAAHVRDGHYEIVDLAPGRYSLVLDEDGGSRDARVHVEILNGRLTILRVTAEVFANDYHVETEYD